MFWNATALDIISKGLTAKKANSLADLAARRQATLGQFFTSINVAEKMWHTVANNMTENERYSIMDNSVGSGRLLAFADPKQHQLFGCDVDERCIEMLSQDASAAGFDFEFSHSGLEDVSFENISVGLINPAFSITLQSPNLFPYPCTNFGKFGPQTHALSHEYALEQALNGCNVVMALLPMSMQEQAFSQKRLVAEIILNRDAFAEEGANVQTAVYVFDSHGRKYGEDVIPVDLNKGEQWPDHIELDIKGRTYQSARWKVNGIDTKAPVFSLPVTGDNRVSIHHHNKQIILKFACVFTEAKVRNGILRSEVDRSDRHRYAKNIAFVGDGQLHIDAYLAHDEPQAMFDGFIDNIRQLGVSPQVSASLIGYFKKCVKRKTLEMTPFRKVVEQRVANHVDATAVRSMLLRKLDIKSPIVKKNDSVIAKITDGGYLITKDDQAVFFSKNDFAKNFVVQGSNTTSTQKAYEWKILHEGKNKAFPHLYAHALKRLEQSGVDFLWPPQRDAICELMMTQGAVAGWEQGSGKARSAIALALASSAKHTLIIVEGGLVEEMRIELGKINLASSEYNIIRGIENIALLAKINIISYNRLKMPIGLGKKTLSHMLRRRFGLVAADEGGILSNPDSQQSRAVLRLAARKLYIFDGTPIGNYPRDLLPLVSATSGESNIINPYSQRQHMLTDNFLNSANYNPRGIMAFKDDFVVLDWATHQFSDNLRAGAKREIPAIANIPAFRIWADKTVQRKLRNEPDFAPFTGIKRPTREYHSINWDKEHLALYIKESVEFAQWFKRYKDIQDKNGKGCNLMAVLARIQAVIGASNSPHIAGERSTGIYSLLTSKQRAVIERTETLIEETDDKIIIMASSPHVCARFHNELRKLGIDSVLFTGQQSIKQRNHEMHHEYRYGKKRVLVMSSVGQRGLNLPQANRFLMYSRSWSADKEEQAIARMLRPDQRKNVFVEYFHLDGGIDEYMAMVVDWKMCAAKAGLDYGENETHESEFRHLDAILAQFCNDVLGESLHEVHKRLCA